MGGKSGGWLFGYVENCGWKKSASKKEAVNKCKSHSMIDQKMRLIG